MSKEKFNISQEEAYNIMQSEKPFILLDVRSVEEFAKGHIENAKLLPVDELVEKAKSELPNKDALILIYCHSGMRAGLAAKQLSDMGYKNVFNFGGIMNWPYSIVND
jgi:rhodanese-related sulfurtransferase